jgi:hypothetical protein
METIEAVPCRADLVYKVDSEENLGGAQYGGASP